MIRHLPPTARLRLLLPAVACVAAALSSCRSVPKEQLEKEKAAAEVKVEQPVLFEWLGDELEGPVSVTIDLSEQKARFTRGGQYAGWSYVAAGKAPYRTPTGSFRITEKVVDKKSGSWGFIVNAEGEVVDEDARAGREKPPPGGRWEGAPMPYWMRINGPIGMHAGYIPEPGQPASHGCIRLPKEMAQILFRVTRIGTPVKVVP